MRDVFTKSLVGVASDPLFVFLTGDLGFSALEPLRDAAGDRFINAGVAEQNMVSVAAGLARSGLRPWAYSIAPFIYARPFEQVRNDVCLHNLGVRLVGNGGGYGYGVMGGTHHALEDYGSLLCLQNMRVIIPAFDADVEAVVNQISTYERPVYLRLGRDEKPADFETPPYAPWRRVIDGRGPTVVAVGPLIGPYLEPLRALPEASRPRVWVVTELPFDAGSIPAEFWSDLSDSRHLVVAEEHVQQGSAGQSLAYLLAASGRRVDRFSHLYARGYVSGRYGSQAYHRKDCGLDAASLLDALA